MASETILDKTRKRLWARSGNRCAFPECEQRLVEPTADRTDDTIVGVECHIVAQKDNPTVARSVSLLTDAEKKLYAHLIEDRHSFENLVLMCGNHSTVIDHVATGYAVAAVLAIKEEHETRIAQRLSLPSATSSEADGTTTVAVSPPLVIVLDDGPEWDKKATARLARKEPEATAWLHGTVGDPADADRVQALIDAWPEQLSSGSFDLSHAVVRQAERKGLWLAAADVWERLADRFEGAERADRLVSAAIDAKLGAETGRYAALLDRAEAVDPDAPRLRLVRLDESEDGMSASEQLDALEALTSDDPNIAALIHVARARAALMIPDVELAEDHLKAAAMIDPTSILARTMRVNIVVQRTRIDLHEDRAFSLPEITKAKEDALALRAELLEMGRWEESARLLMLAGDVPALSHDFTGARKVLNKVQPQELASTDGAIVLGEAALRINAADLALSMTENAERTDAIRRIRAAATLDQSGRPDEESLDELRSIALAERPESESAAVARLVACLPPVKAPWDKEVAGALRGVGAERFAPSLHIMSLLTSNKVDEAQALADELPDTMWAAELQLRIAAGLGVKTKITTAARTFLQYGPDAPGRLLAAGALRRAGETEDAARLLKVIAHETNASPIVRSDAYAVWLDILKDQGAWEEAQTELEGWKKLANRSGKVDTRISPWEVTIAHNVSQR